MMFFNYCVPYIDSIDKAITLCIVVVLSGVATYLINKDLKDFEDE